VLGAVVVSLKIDLKLKIYFKSIMTDRVSQLANVQTEALNLFSKKNKDYGDAFATYGTVGVLVRMGDKIHRLQNITKNGINLVDDEKLRDTLIDLHNYAAMGVMLIDEDDKVVLEDNNPKLQEVSWGIYGSTGNQYVRSQLREGSNILRESCSCPDFKFRGHIRQCKHIRTAWDESSSEN